MTLVQGSDPRRSISGDPSLFKTDILKKKGDQKGLKNGNAFDDRKILCFTVDLTLLSTPNIY